MTVKVKGVTPGTTDIRFKYGTSGPSGTGVVTVKGLVVSVPNTVVAVGGKRQATIAVKDTDGNPQSGITLSLDSLDDLKASGTWIGGASTVTTDSLGQATLELEGVSAGQTLLKIKASTSAGAEVIGEGTITVELPVITISDQSIVTGGSKVVTVKVTDRYGNPLTGVQLKASVPTIQTIASVNWLNTQGDEFTDESGEAELVIWGLSVGHTAVTIKAVDSGAKVYASITVTDQ